MSLPNPQQRPPVGYAVGSVPLSPPTRYVPPPVRTVRRAGLPLVGIILAGVGAALVAYMALVGATNIGTFLVAVVIAGIGAAVVIAAYMWLDRWEPEPPALLIWAFLWGGGVATVGALVLQEVFRIFVWGNNDVAATIIGAPLFEEGFKGLFLLVMLTGLRRHEMNSLTDCLVYAGMSAIGFAFVENLLYFGTSESIEQTGFMLFARIIMGAFAHPFFTTMTGIGVWASMRQRNGGAKVLCILAGYVGAMILHGLWNASSSFGLGTYFGTYAVVMVPSFIILVRQAIRSRRQEGQTVRAELPEMVWTGLITPHEAGWLGSLRSRRDRTRGLTRDKARIIDEYVDAVTELAFVRNRIKRGFSTPELQARQAELALFVGGLHSDATTFMAPMAAGAQPIHPTPPPQQAPMPTHVIPSAWREAGGAPGAGANGQVPQTWAPPSGSTPFGGGDVPPGSSGPTPPPPNPWERRG